MIMEDFLEEVVPELSLEGHVGISRAEGVGENLREETDSMKAGVWAVEATGHPKLKVGIQGTRSRRKGSKEGTRLENQTKTK